MGNKKEDVASKNSKIPVHDTGLWDYEKIAWAILQGDQNKALNLVPEYWNAYSVDVMRGIFVQFQKHFDQMGGFEDRAHKRDSLQSFYSDMLVLKAGKKPEEFQLFLLDMILPHAVQHGFLDLVEDRFARQDMPKNYKSDSLFEALLQVEDSQYQYFWQNMIPLAGRYLKDVQICRQVFEAVVVCWEKNRLKGSASERSDFVTMTTSLLLAKGMGLSRWFRDQNNDETRTVGSGKVYAVRQAYKAHQAGRAHEQALKRRAMFTQPVTPQSIVDGVVHWVMAENPQWFIQYELLAGLTVEQQTEAIRRLDETLVFFQEKRESSQDRLEEIATSILNEFILLYSDGVILENNENEHLWSSPLPSVVRQNFLDFRAGCLKFANDWHFPRVEDLHQVLNVKEVAIATALEEKNDLAIGNLLVEESYVANINPVFVIKGLQYLLKQYALGVFEQPDVMGQVIEVTGQQCHAAVKSSLEDILQDGDVKNLDNRELRRQLIGWMNQMVAMQRRRFR